MSKLMDSRPKENNPVREAFYKALDREVNKGWDAFVKEIRFQNDKSNQRLLKIISKIKGNDFANNLASFHKSIQDHSRMRIERKPIGLKMKDDKYAIKEFWIDQRCIAGEYHGNIYVQVKPSRFVKIRFSR